MGHPSLPARGGSGRDLLDGDHAVPSGVLLLVHLDVGAGYLADGVDVTAPTPDDAGDSVGGNGDLLGSRNGNVFPLMDSNTCSE